MRPAPTLAQRLPDLPRWVEVRDLLMSGDGELLGLAEEPELSLVVRDPGTASAFVVGAPTAAAVHAAVDRNAGGGEVIAPPERAAHVAQLLPGWTCSRVILHLLSDHGRLPAAAGEVDFLDPTTLGGLELPDDLRHELACGAESSPIAATFADGRPVSFCYAGAVTESLWDVAIDTLAAHRRRGHAASCAAHMIRHMARQGKHPVWAALAENPPSWRLARKLGFAEVDELALFQPMRREGGW